MASKFARDLLAFRQHVVALRRLGFAHVSVKYDGQEYHVEGPGLPATASDGEEVDEEWDTLGRRK